ncbi:cofactor-independent phosphoglycerate mutase [Candidatus Manganitrophus noduliformans]|uniref:Cofactor-independent phosphoglycerate mutase n=1 Tax=Candidatus Manganitrophus noduliformans TaxID=2606439 RepID=A0A7X6DU32_9BACT|nr:cofactor-independent phosphoglycerate mutase [Candidatus Manganitrophus noduliformans]NKE73364.1 cofactor-independent phosphoglycerate mutase [Candidatus Manganitrophus noduliformans]
MKYVVLVADGMADRPIEALGGRTPLEAAKTPNIDLLATCGEIGLVRTTPDGFVPGSDVAHLSIFGYDPRRFYPGRGALESAGMEVSLNEGDVAFRCNLVTLRDRQKGYAFNELSARVFLEDPTAGKIGDEEARELIDLLNNLLGSDQIQFYTGKGYRHLMVWVHGVSKVECLPPHKLIDKEIVSVFPRGADKGILKKLVQSAFTVLLGHPVNEERMARGERPANGVWFWGPGREAELLPFSERFGKRGTVISEADFLRGLGRKTGMKVIDVPGGDDAAKVKAASEALDAHDLAYLHFEACDAAGHAGDLQLKVEAIERFDRQIVGPLLSQLKEKGPWRLLLLSDHATPVSTRDAVADPVPFLLCRGLGGKKEERAFSERDAAGNAIFWPEGHRLMEHFLRA